MSKVSIQLAWQASNIGICNEWLQELKSTEDIDKMLDMYLKGIDFCLSNDFPTNDYIQKTFKGKMEHKGIHLDENLVVQNESKVVVLGMCTGLVHVFDYNVSEVFIKHNSDITIIAEGNAFVMVDIFDDAKLKVVTNDNAKVCVNRYNGNDIDAYSNGNSVIKVINKQKKTY